LDTWPASIVSYRIESSGSTWSVRSLLGAFRAGRSDIDFVAVVDRPARSGGDEPPPLLARGFGHRNSCSRRGAPPKSLTGTCNGVFVDIDELANPVTRIRPLASQRVATSQSDAPSTSTR